MKKIAICMADGVEEIEALTVVDLCRRAGMEIDMISTQNRGRAMGGHGIQFETDLNIKDTDFKEYDGIILKQKYKSDIVCYNKIILEIKAVSKLQDVHKSQLYNYLRATGYKLGILINFGCAYKLEYERIIL